MSLRFSGAQRDEANAFGPQEARQPDFRIDYRATTSEVQCVFLGLPASIGDGVAARSKRQFPDGGSTVRKARARRQFHQGGACRSTFREGGFTTRKLSGRIAWAPVSRHGNPIQVALHALAPEGVYIGSWTGRNVARGNHAHSRQLQDLLLGLRPMEDTFRNRMARGQWQDVYGARVIPTQTPDKQMFPVAGPQYLRRGRELCPNRSAAIGPEHYRGSAQMRA